MDFFERLGSLFTGKGFTTENERKKKEREQQPQSAPAPRPTPININVRPPSAPVWNSKPGGPALLPMVELPGRPQQSQTTSLTDDDKKMIEEYNTAVSPRAFDESRRILKGILNDPTHRDYERAKRLAPHINMNKVQDNFNRTIRDTGKFATDIAKAPIDVIQSVPKSAIRIGNQLTGNKETDLGDFWGRVLGAQENKVGNLSSYGREIRTGVSGMFGNVTDPAKEEGSDPWLGLGLALLDLTPAFGAAAGARLAARQGVRAGINRATGGRNVFTQSDIGGVPQAEASAAIRQGVRFGDISNFSPTDTLLPPSSPNVRIPVRQNIPITDISEEIPIQVNQPPRSLIREIGGDAQTTADGVVPQQQPVTLPRTSNRMDDVRSGSPTSPDTITRQELDAEIAAIRSDKNLTTKEKNDLIKQLEDSGGTKIPVRQQVSVDTQTTAPKIAKKDIKDSQQGEKTITQQEVEKMKQAQEAEDVGVPANQLENMTPQDRENTVAALQNTLTAPAREPSANLDNVVPNVEGSDLDFLRSINPVTQSNISAARQSIRNLSKVRKADKSDRNAAMRRAVEAARARGASSEEIAKVRTAALKGEYAKTEYKGQGIGEEAEQRLIKMIDDDPDLAGQEFSKLNITNAFRNLYHTGEDGYPNHIQKADLRYIGQWLNRKVPGMGDAFEEAVKELDNVSDANIATQIFAVPRSVVASADVGGIGRQAFPLGLMNPKEFKDAIKTSFKGMFSQKNYDESVKALTRDKDYFFIADDLKVALPSVHKGDFTNAEQFAASNLAEKIPGLGQIVKVSQRQYEMLLTQLRFNIAKKYIQKNGGIDGINRAANDTGHPEVFKQAVGDYVNTFSGKSDIGGIIKKNPQAMHSLFFSAPNLASKIQRLNPLYYNKLRKQNPQVAKMAATNAAIHLATVGSVIAGAASLGLIENGKIKIGNTRYDVTGGLASVLSTGAKMYQAMQNPDKGIFDKTASDEFGQFLRNQFNPSIALFLNHFDTKPKEEGGGVLANDRVTKYGEDYNSLGEFTKGSLVPLSIQSVFDDINAGVPPQQIAANLIAELVGVGVNTYESGEDRKAREASEFSDEAGILAKYLPEGQTEYTHDVLTGISDKAFYESDWEAFTEARRQQLEMVKNSESSTKAKRDKAELELKRAEFYQEAGNIPPEIIDQYKDIGVEMWRKMGDPRKEEYNPELYAQLKAIDDAMTSRGISYNTTGGKGPKFNKYTEKGSKGGGGGSRRNQFSGLSGTTVNWDSFLPKVEQYDATSLMPNVVQPPAIRAENPRIIHKITSS